MTSRRNSPEKTPAMGIVTRLFWMCFGYLLLFALAGMLWKGDGSGMLALSVLYWATVGLIVAARYIDIHRYRGKTAHGEPATIQHWRRHAVTLLPIAGLVWAAAAFVA